MIRGETGELMRCPDCKGSGISGFLFRRICRRCSGYGSVLKSSRLVSYSRDCSIGCRGGWLFILVCLLMIIGSCFAVAVNPIYFLLGCVGSLIACTFGVLYIDV